MSKYKDKDRGEILSFSASWVSWAHTVVAYTAFISALVVGMYLHFNKIVQNEHYGYPDEWFPSVSATIGDRYPERSFFMVFIAITSVPETCFLKLHGRVPLSKITLLTETECLGPRFALVALWYLLTARSGKALPKFVAGMGLFRTLTCGGWTYVTSTDDHDWHDIFMIAYLVATIPWTAGCIALSPPNERAVRYRKYLATAFFGNIPFMVYFFIQHKVHRVAGAYTTYAFFEWSLILFDVAFDAVTALDFMTFEIVIKDVKGLSKGKSMTSRPAVELEKDKKKATAGVFDAKFSWSEALDTAAEVYHGYVFWSTLTGLGIVIWYFPLWYMGISGFEVFVMSPIGPMLLGIKSVRGFVTRHLRLFHFLSLTGLLAFKVEDPASRLFVIGFSVFTASLAWAATLYSESVHEARLEPKVMAWLIGLVLHAAIKFAWQTSNPIWPIVHAENGGYNVTGLVLALFATWRFTRKAPLNTGLGTTDDKEGGSAFLAALGVGGVWFGLHSLLSDTSTMISWVWEGYPVRGPLAAPHGWYTMAAMTAGLLTGIRQPGLVTTWSFYGMGSVAAAVLTLYSHWTGFVGGVVLAFYLAAIASPLLAAAAKKRPGLTFGFGFFVYNVMVLFHVWVVAYAFVPGGPLVREHTDWIMITMMLLIGAGVFNLTAMNARRSGDSKVPSITRHRKYHTLALAAINIMFLAAAYIRFPTNDYQPYHADSRIMTAGIWTVHFSLDNDCWSSEYRMRDLIKELEIDVIGLLESDLQRIIMGNRDPTQFLAEELGMYVDYGPGPNKHTWGSALLSKFPIVNSTHHLLPSPVGELAPAIAATLDMYGELVDVYVFHSGQEEDPEDRRLQSEYLAKLMGSSKRPAVLLSYLVVKPLQGNYNTYVSATSGMHDVEPRDWDRWCEYILYKGLQRVGYARVSRSTITDTELQVAKFVIPRGEAEKAQVAALDGDAAARNRKAKEQDVPEGWRFPALFRGKGVRGHRYHVFNEPWYYKPQ
ncbi:Frag1/DRAM/Sfk1 family-domain-containing protein [Xylariomycetidae sp. FL0641]|nr:Frag1/DRAM/Sfk1 family-domain-containing protein [Xylariomycetidae sp. FL0641]